MYNAASIIFITSCIILSVNSKAFVEKNQTVKQSIHDKLLELSTKKCPYLKTTKLLEPTQTCQDYDTVSHITKLTRETQYTIPCLLYYNSFVSLCETILNINLADSIDNNKIDEAVKANTLADVCVNLKALSVLPVSGLENSTELIKNISTNEYFCGRVCGELLDNTATPICSLAAYNVKMTLAIRKALDSQKKVPQSSAVKISDQHEQTVITKPLLTTNNNNSKSEGESRQTIPDEHKDTLINKPESPSIEKKVKPAPQKDEVQPSAPVNKPQAQEKQIPKVEQVNPPIVHPPEIENVPKDEALTNENVNEQQLDVPNVAAVGSIPDTQPAGQNNNVDVDKETSSKTAAQTNPDETKLPPEDNPAPLNKSPPKIVDENQESIEEMGEAREDQMNEGQNEELGDDEETIPDGPDMSKKIPEKIDKARVNTKPQEINEDELPPPYNSNNTEEEDSFFFIYFMMVCAVFILGYIGYHNKQKVLALVIEGRRGKRGSRRGRPNSANYHKLDSNLEEAVTSSCNKNPTNIIY